jgi:hypothetical protein
MPLKYAPIRVVALVTALAEDLYRSKYRMEPKGVDLHGFLLGHMISRHGLTAKEVEAMPLATVAQMLQANLGSGDRSPIQASEQDSEARHSVDFRSVHWYGRDFIFTANQAIVVGLLWEALERGTPDVGDRYLLATSGSEAERVVDVFKSKGKKHPAWGTMIVAKSKGTHRLQMPNR